MITPQERAQRFADAMAVLRELLDRQDEFLGDDCVKLLDDLEFAARCLLLKMPEEEYEQLRDGVVIQWRWPSPGRRIRLPDLSGVSCNKPADWKAQDDELWRDRMAAEDQF